MGPVQDDFKSNPKKAIQKLIDSQQLAEDAEAIAKFLLTTPGLDDAALGDYVGDGDGMCASVLKHYVSTFNFVGLGFDDALRKFLSAFRLPGEAQKIERIMECFAAQFYAHNPESFRHADTPFKLAYSLIMLNTDAHNPAIKASRKMTKEQFVRNNRGLDAGHDLPQEFLETMHDRIVANEIKMQPFKNDAGDKSILAYTNPYKQGWLKKESGRFKAWQERWFLLKDSCLYYLRKPPVWGAEVELSGHVPLHAKLVARSARDSDPGSFYLEMSDGSMLKTGKIEEKAAVMKTRQLTQLRLLASSHAEAQEWVTAITTKVKALSEAHRTSALAAHTPISVKAPVQVVSLPNMPRVAGIAGGEVGPDPWATPETTSPLHAAGVAATVHATAMKSTPTALEPFNLERATEKKQPKPLAQDDGFLGLKDTAQEEADGADQRQSSKESPSQGQLDGKGAVSFASASAHTTPFGRGGRRGSGEVGSWGSALANADQQPAQPAGAQAKKTVRLRLHAGLEACLTMPSDLVLDADLGQRLASYYGRDVSWPHSEDPRAVRKRALSPLHMALAGFTFEPDADYNDRVVCDMCGLSVGSWEDEDDPMQAHVQFVSESLAEDGSNSCSFAGDFGAAYHALLAQDMEIKLVPVHASPATQAKSGPTPTRAPLSVVSGAEVDGRKAGGADGMAATGWRHDGHVAMRRPDGITTESLDSEFEEALVRLERVSQRLVVEQQYGQRLEALTGSLVGKIQSWVVRLRKEEASRDQLQETLASLRRGQADLHAAQGNGAASAVDVVPDVSPTDAVSALAKTGRVSSDAV